MKRTHPLTAILQREADGYEALCPELDIASQGDSIEQARDNLAEAVQAFFEAADASEIERRLHILLQRREPGTTITVPVPDHAELRTGTLLSIIRPSGLSRSLFEEG